MKRRAKPAAMDEEDLVTGEARPNTRTIASIFSPTKGSFPLQRIQRRKPRLPTLGYMQSMPLGSIQDAVSINSDGGLLTILAGEHDDNHRVWKESGRHRVFFYPDRIINGDTKTYITREITISRLDLARPNPELIIGQRVYNTFGTVELRAHQLHFEPSIDVNRPYLFFGLGDEIPGVGYPDLHCTFRIVSDWESAARQADTSRFDLNVFVNITLRDVQSDRKVTYDTQNIRLAQRGVKPALGIEVLAAELFPLPTSPVASAFWPGPRGRKRRSVREDWDGIRVRPEQKSVLVKLIGAGAKIGDGELKAGVNVHFVFTE